MEMYLWYYCGQKVEYENTGDQIRATFVKGQCINPLVRSSNLCWLRFHLTKKNTKSFKKKETISVTSFSSMWYNWEICITDFISCFSVVYWNIIVDNDLIHSLFHIVYISECKLSLPKPCIQPVRLKMLSHCLSLEPVW